MRKVLIVSVILALLFSITASAQNGEGPKKLEPLSRDLEIELALSALPPHLRDNATVYVLNPDKALKSPIKARMDSTPLLLEPAMIRSGGLGP